MLKVNNPKKSWYIFLMQVINTTVKIPEVVKRISFIQVNHVKYSHGSFRQWSSVQPVTSSWSRVFDAVHNYHTDTLVILYKDGVNSFIYQLL